MFKVIFRRLHLLLALIGGILLINLSVSGALLIYAKDIQRLINPHYWLVNIEENNSIEPLALSVLVEKIALLHSEKIHLIEQGEQPNHVWQVRLTNKQYLNLNPYTGDIVLRHSFYDTFYGFVMAWHRWLLYSNDQGERPFQLWVSIASLLFIIELIIGLTLWLKPKYPIKRLRVRWQAKNKIRFHQLHLFLGAVCAIPLILIAFSGMAFFWQDATKAIVEAVTVNEITSRSAPPSLNVIEDTIASHNLDMAYKQASNALSLGQVYRIYMPQKLNLPLALRIKMPDETHAYSWSWSNPYTGENLHHFDASKQNIATKVWQFKYKFHIGDFLGWPVSVLWLILSLLPSFFVISGLYLAWQRHKQKR